MEQMDEAAEPSAQAMRDAGESVPDLVPVVGLGGSAGSIEALQEFLRQVPEDSPLAYVVVIHLAPDQVSELAQVLQHATRLPVMQVSRDARIEAGRVYVLAPGTLLTVSGPRLRVIPSSPERRSSFYAVDAMLRSLADSHGPQSAAVVLSGLGQDGAIGLRRIKERGGLTLAQELGDAQEPEMPRAAMDTQMVDWVVPAAQMPARLHQYFRLGAHIGQDRELLGEQDKGDDILLAEILAFLRVRTARDFSHYKQPTVLRRIARRMQVNDVATLGGYLQILRTSPGEAGALLQDLLISVTNFFRDPDCFEQLEQQLQALLHTKTSGQLVRVWVPGCATGEEAYSIAILLVEYVRRHDLMLQVQVFASDLSEDAISVAREGAYPTSIEADVSEERLRRFFVREGGVYRVRRELRELILFAQHDLLADSPFSRIDLVSCRNVLIYLDREAQKRVLSTLHFSLVPGGLLFLGSSESIDDGSPLFDSLDKKHRLFRHKVLPAGMRGVPSVTSSVLQSLDAHLALTARAPVVLPALPSNAPLEVQHFERPARDGVPLAQLHMHVLEDLSPPSILVNRDYEILHLSPSAGRFLFQGGGEMTPNLLRALAPALQLEVQAALLEADATGAAVSVSPVAVEQHGTATQVGLRVVKARFSEGLYLVQLLEGDAQPAMEEFSIRRSAPELVSAHLEAELQRSRTQLRATVEQYGAANEELKSRNEELQASIEELRSAAEELETSREELQSVNEELSTVNHELKRNVDELSNANADMENLLDVTQVITVFLDRDLRITRYSPAAVTLFSLIPTDVRRPLTDLKAQLDYPQLKADALRVLDKLVPIEREVQHADGRWYLARLLPYRTGDHRIAGVVLSFVDNSALKQWHMTSMWFGAVLRATSDAVMIFSPDGVILSWNPGAQRLFGHAPEDAIGRPVAMLAAGREAEQQQTFAAVMRGETVEGMRTTRTHKDGHPIDIVLTLAPVLDDGRVVAGTAIARAA